ncbi:MAG: alpha/beta hydrolase [Bacteroidetes bacterium]|nr:alpha/beta hydrolase [Bacteroidota bacterium]
MIKLRYSSLIFLFIFSLLTSNAQEEPVKDPYIKLAKQFIGAVKRNEYHKNHRFFDSSFYGKAISAQTQKMVEDFLNEKGPIVAIEKTVADTQGCKMATCTSIKTAKGKFLWYHYFDQAERIQRFAVDTFDQQWFYVPGLITNKNFTRKEIVIEPNAFIRLPGSLYVPNGNKKSPMVILVHGSGPQDRNVSVGKNKVFLDMALDLVQKGVSVLIYDKRTYVYQYHDPFPMDSMDYYSETVDDAVAAFKLAKTFKDIDTSRIYIGGHSQGALCGPLIAKGCKGLKGLILLAAPGRSLLEIIPEQLDYVNTFVTQDKARSEEISNAIKWQVKNALKPDLNLKSKVMLPFGAKPKYWLMDRNYKVLEEAKKLTLPVYLLQGGRDYNVTKTDYDLWTNAMTGKPNFKSYWYEDLDHMFFEGLGKGKPEDAVKPNHVSKKITDKLVEIVTAK